MVNGLEGVVTLCNCFRILPAVFFAGNKNKMSYMRRESITVYAKDVQRITGKSDRYARQLLKKIRGHFKKEGHQFISVNDFCAYTGLSEQDVAKHLD